MKRKWWVGLAALVILGAAVLCIVIANENTKWPQEGSTVWRDSKLKVDVSNIQEGYFYACTASKTNKRLKMRVIKGDVTLTYDLNNKGDMELFPLQLGSGNYKVCLFENISGKKYSQVGTINFRAQLTSEDVAFLYPNVFVNYTPESPAVAEADALCEGKTPKQAFDAVCAYMKNNYSLRSNCP